MTEWIERWRELVGTSDVNQEAALLMILSEARQEALREAVEKIPNRQKFFSERNGIRERSDYEEGYDDCREATLAALTRLQASKE